MLKFHWLTYVGWKSLSGELTYLPPVGKGIFGLTLPNPLKEARIGIGFWPGCEAPPAKPPKFTHGFVRVAAFAPDMGGATVFPKGAANCSWLKESMLIRSPNIPYAARITMRPSPLGSHASPT